MSDVVGRVIPVIRKDWPDMVGEIAKAQVTIYSLRRALKDARNELCLKCGKYHESYLGACDGCRYKRGGEWEEDLDE